MLIASGAAQGLTVTAAACRKGDAHDGRRAPLLGILNSFAPLLDDDEKVEAALQNITEWWGGLAFTLFFFAMAWLWRTARFEVRFSRPMA